MSVTGDTIDITRLRNVSSGVIAQEAKTAPTNDENTYPGNFGSVFQTAVDNINTTNSYLSDAEDEEINWALGKSANSHDLAIALQKASTSLQYTVAVRDKLLAAYKEIVNMQI
jgi:flagellar hook-basal body complex protein FliE